MPSFSAPKPRRSAMRALDSAFDGLIPNAARTNAAEHGRPWPHVSSLNRASPLGIAAEQDLQRTAIVIAVAAPFGVC